MNIERFLIHLNEVRYCILHGWQRLAEHFSTDLDIAIVPEDLSKLEKRLCCIDRARLIQLLQHESTTCYYFILAVDEEGWVRFVSIDAATDYRGGRRMWFRTEELLRGCRQWKGFWVAAPEVEFKYLLVKKILKVSIPELTKHRLQDLVQELERGADEIAEKLLGKRWGKDVISWIRVGNWQVFKDHLSLLKKVILRKRIRDDPINSFRYWVPKIRCIWRSWRVLTGLAVAVLGPDGAGKSTLIERLQQELKGAFCGTAVFHLMPGLLCSKSPRGPVTDPYSKPPRSTLMSLLKLAYYLFDYVMGYWLKVRPALSRTILVLFDRYYNDLFVDPRRYRYGGPLWLVRLLERLIPKPDLYLILDVSEEEIRRRKQEVSFNELSRQRKLYRKLAIELPNGFLLDGRQPPEVVAQQARSLILEHLHLRYLARRRLWFPKNVEDPLGWLAKVLNAQVYRGGTTHAYFRLPDGRGYLLPIQNARVFRRALDLYPAQTRKARLVKQALQGLSLARSSGFGLPKVNLEVRTPGESVVETLRQVFGRRDLVFAVFLGTPGPQRKPVLQVMTPWGRCWGTLKWGGMWQRNLL